MNKEDCDHGPPKDVPSDAQSCTCACGWRTYFKQLPVEVNTSEDGSVVDILYKNIIIRSDTKP